MAALSLFTWVACIFPYAVPWGASSKNHTKTTQPPTSHPTPPRAPLPMRTSAAFEHVLLLLYSFRRHIKGSPVHHVLLNLP